MSNYRVIKRTFEDGIVYSVNEVELAADGEVLDVSTEPVILSEDTLVGLETKLHAYTRALGEPIITVVKLGRATPVLVKDEER